MSVQYRVVFGKKDEAVDGPDEADVIISVGVGDATLDPSVAFMQGKLRATGDTGELFQRLKSGEVAEALARLSRRA
jgi:hypothetical protein